MNFKEILILAIVIIASVVAGNLISYSLEKSDKTNMIEELENKIGENKIKVEKIGNDTTEAAQNVINDTTEAVNDVIPTGLILNLIN